MKSTAVVQALHRLMSLRDKIAFNVRHHMRQPHPARSLMLEAIVRSGLYRFICFRRNGAKLRLRRSGISPQLWANPDLVLDGECFLNAYLRSGDVMVDIGANIGTHSILGARLVGVNGTILAIEPHPDTYAALIVNLRLNACRNVRAQPLAVGPECSTVHFSNEPGDDWNHVTPSGTIVVSQMPLDSVAAELPHIDLLKIDVEGYELPCLRGAKGTLARTHCVLLEYWEEHTRRFGYDLRNLTAWLDEAGFVGFVLQESGSALVLESLPSDGKIAGLRNLVFARSRVILDARLHATWMARPEVIR